MIRGIDDKGGFYASGTSRMMEKELPLSEAEELMKRCEPGIIDKTRYLCAVASIYLKSTILW
jgi:CYTH domain-containing protein